MWCVQIHTLMVGCGQKAWNLLRGAVASELLQVWEELALRLSAKWFQAVEVMALPLWALPKGSKGMWALPKGSIV